MGGGQELTPVKEIASINASSIGELGSTDGSRGGCWRVLDRSYRAAMLAAGMARMPPVRIWGSVKHTVLRRTQTRSAA